MSMKEPSVHFHSIPELAAPSWAQQKKHSRRRRQPVMRTDWKNLPSCYGVSASPYPLCGDDDALSLEEQALALLEEEYLLLVGEDSLQEGQVLVQKKTLLHRHRQTSTQGGRQLCLSHHLKFVRQWGSVWLTTSHDFVRGRRGDYFS